MAWIANECSSFVVRSNRLILTILKLRFHLPFDKGKGKRILSNVGGQTSKSCLLTRANNVKCRWSSGLKHTTFHSESAAPTTSSTAAPRKVKWQRLWARVNLNRRPLAQESSDYPSKLSPLNYSTHIFSLSIWAITTTSRVVGQKISSIDPCELSTLAQALLISSLSI